MIEGSREGTHGMNHCPEQDPRASHDINWIAITWFVARKAFSASLIGSPAKLVHNHWYNAICLFWYSPIRKMFQTKMIKRKWLKCFMLCTFPDVLCRYSFTFKYLDTLKNTWLYYISVHFLTTVVIRDMLVSKMHETFPFVSSALARLQMLQKTTALSK